MPRPRRLGPSRYGRCSAATTDAGPVIGPPEEDHPRLPTQWHECSMKVAWWREVAARAGKSQRRCDGPGPRCAAVPQQLRRVAAVDGGAPGAGQRVASSPLEHCDDLIARRAAPM